MSRRRIVLQSNKQTCELRQSGIVFVVWLKSIMRSGTRREDHAMRAFFIACVIALILAIGGYYALSAIQEPVAEAFSTSAVRLSS